MIKYYINSAQGNMTYAQPVDIYLQELEEGTDYAGYQSYGFLDTARVETYAEGTENELKCVSFQLRTPKAFDQVANIGIATSIIHNIEMLQDENENFVMDKPFTEVSGTQPEDWEVHRRDHYYKTKDVYTIGGHSETYYYNGTAANEAWQSGQTYYKEDSYCQMIWTESGGCFGVGCYIVRPAVGDYGVILSGGSRCSKPASGDVCYPTGVGGWEPRFRGMDGEAMFPETFGNVNRRNPASFYKGITNYTPFAVKGKLSLCQFVYQDEAYIGVVAVQYNADDSLKSVGCWGISANWWVSSASNYNYVADSDGTVKKAQNPAYIRHVDAWGAKALPNNNRIVQGTNFVKVVDNTPYGFATYKLSNAEYQTVLGEWSNNLSKHLGGFFDRVGTGFNVLANGIKALNSVFGNPIESILQCHTVPIPSVYIPAYQNAGNDLPYVRSGGANSSISSAGHLLNNQRHLDLEFVSRYIVGRKTGWYDDWTNTQFSIYLPFIGEVPLPIEYTMPQNIYVRYRVDVLTGNFTVRVCNGWTDFYVNTGNCASPVLAASSATLQERALANMGSILTKGLNVATSAATGNAPGAVLGAVVGASNLTKELQQHVSYSSTGGTTSLSSGYYEPILFIKRPIQASGDFGSILGFMSGSSGQLSRFKSASGGLAFVSAVAANVRGINKATEAEKAEIDSLLKAGVWV